MAVNGAEPVTQVIVSLEWEVQAAQQGLESRLRTQGIQLASIKLVLPDGDLVRRAVEARAAYGLHFYDGMNAAAAERAKCGRIWSEDLNAGQEYFGVTVVNPFKST